PAARRRAHDGGRPACDLPGRWPGRSHPGRVVRRLRRSPGASPAKDAGPVGRRGDMRWQLRQVADLTAGEQAAPRPPALAVYPPEVAAAWPGRAVEWAPHQWGVIGWDAEGAALCYAGAVLREARWDDRAVRVGGIGGVKTHPAFRGRGFASTAV